MEFGRIFLVVNGLPEKNWVKNLDSILLWAFIAVFLAYSTITMVRSYRRNRYCTCCRSKTVLGCRREKADTGKGRVYFGGKRIFAGTVVNYTIVLRCPKCGWEIDLGK